jgi:hypothetical protein
MALPYPLEVETGRLSDRPAKRLRPTPISERVDEAIHCDADGLYAFGKKIVADDGRSNGQACKDLRAALLRRVQQRLPFADESDWAHASRLIGAQLNDGDTVARAARTLVLTVDSM